MSSFSPTAAELALVNSVFALADPQKLGIITGDKAVETFSGASLPPAVLGEIWAISDKENNGFLTRKGVAVAVRLIGYAQKGEKVNESLLDRRVYSFRFCHLSTSVSHCPSWSIGTHRRHIAQTVCAAVQSSEITINYSVTSTPYRRGQDQVPPSFPRLWSQ